MFQLRFTLPNNRTARCKRFVCHRYDAALAKANYATLAANMAPDGGDAGGAEEEDDDVRAALEASMRRSRVGASQRKDADAVATEIVKRRQQEEAQPAADIAGGSALSALSCANAAFSVFM